MDPPNGPSATPWRILHVDDEAVFRESFKLALQRIEIEGQPLEVIPAGSTEQAIEILRDASDGDFALVVVDVVMEDEHAGLRLVRHIREERQFYATQIAICTGQPGFAPPLKIASELDINDYRVKAKMEHSDIICLVYTSIRAYRTLDCVRQATRTMQQAAGAIATVAGRSDPKRTAQESAEQLLSIADLAAVEILVRNKANEFVVLGRAASPQVSARCLQDLEAARKKQQLAPKDELRQGRRTVHRQSGEVELVVIAVGDDINSFNSELISIFAGSILSAIWGANLAERAAASEKLAAIGNYAASIAHDIKNAQTILQASTDQLQLARDAGKPASPELLSTCIELIEGASKRIEASIQSALSRPIDSPTDEECLVEPVIRNCVSTLTATESGVRINILDFPKGYTVACSELALARVLDNLIANSVKALRKAKPPVSEISIGAECQGANVQISVSDNGCGIAPDVLEQIFQPFYTTSGNRGKGLGLAICDAIISQAGGQISVSSKLGVGTSFVITLPRGSAEEADNRIPNQQAVMLVSSDVRMVNVLRSRLSAHEVLHRFTTQQAISSSGTTIDHLWIDETCLASEVRTLVTAYRSSLGDSLPIALLVSGENSPSLRQAATELGLEIIMKPLSDDFLASLGSTDQTAVSN